MKTPMQELIEWTDKLISILPEDSIGVRNQLIIVREKTESLLEKEKEQIMDAWIEGGGCSYLSIESDMILAEEYYNETFKTTEQ